MNMINKIHRILYNHTKKIYSFNISYFDIKPSDKTEDILKKIEAMSHVVAHPDEWFILKKKS